MASPTQCEEPEILIVNVQLLVPSIISIITRNKLILLTKRAS
jgi:hypothetical protein